MIADSHIMLNDSVINYQTKTTINYYEPHMFFKHKQ